MGKDRRQEKAEVDESLGKKADKFGKKGDGKKAATTTVEKSFSHQECRHILVEKQSEALRISEEIHEGRISFNEAAFKYSMDKAGAHGLLGWKAQHEVSALNTTPSPIGVLTHVLRASCVEQLDQDFWKAALTCKEGDWLREPIKTQWGCASSRL